MSANVDKVIAGELLEAVGAVLKRHRDALQASRAGTAEIGLKLLSFVAALDLMRDDLVELLLDVSGQRVRAHGLKTAPAELLHDAIAEAGEQLREGLPPWRPQ